MIGAKRCTRCVLSENFPGISFDSDGVCNFCRDEIIARTEEETIKKAVEEIQNIIDEKKGTSKYDAVVCYSGGKDSTYTLKLAVDKYGLNVLSFTLDNGYIAQTAWDNIHRVVDVLGIDQITVRPSRKVYNKVIRESALNKVYPAMTLRRISSGCNSCISMVNTMSLQIALEKRIPLIIAGFTLGQIPANGIIFKNNYTFLHESRQRSLSILKEKVGEKVEDYLTLDPKVLEDIDVYPFTMNILCVEDISEEEIVKQILPLGWERPGDVDGCSSNCTLNAFNNYIHEQTFGYSPYELELSHLINSGHLSRGEALEKLEDQPIDQIEQVKQDLFLQETDLISLKNLYVKKK